MARQIYQKDSCNLIVTPNEKTNIEVKTEGHYLCPTCQAQSTASEVEIGWVSCPMIAGKDICVGCCIDFQVVASSENFETHSMFDEFLKLANKYRKSPHTLRIICLNHQIELGKDFLKYKGPKNVSDKEVEEFLNYLINLRSKIIGN